MRTERRPSHGFPLFSHALAIVNPAAALKMANGPFLVSNSLQADIGSGPELAGEPVRRMPDHFHGRALGQRFLGC
jgi:hypothetical protein